MRVFIIFLAVAFCAFSGPVMVVASAPPVSDDAPVLVISPNAALHVAQEGGRVVGPAVAPFAVLATGPEGFGEKITNSNAWYARHGAWLARICGVSI